ncbi:capsid portal protein [Paenibacillus sp. V4I3]|uniref:hypothetical protein n=1 Tax=unclassified Paenibacillus TaxID=185978 RepID=UPI002785E066|nr:MULTISPECIES: hypothetical protein [unclassified Paenibacillus]MDQ0876246.1 capsid portal protein [Paenibacillus sp. V4I3]MDQ0887721.1 capsid portal protein [Paenibacillus sp. V4I9]
MNPISNPGEFTELDRFMFESWGYLIIPNVLSEDEVKECLEASIRLHESADAKGLAQVGKGYETESALERLIDHPAVYGEYGDDPMKP